MYIPGQRCLSLGTEDKKGGEYKGVPYEGYTNFSFIAFGENFSRRIRLDDGDLKKQVLKICSEWGTEFLLWGNTTEKGAVKIEKIEPVEENSLGLL